MDDSARRELACKLAREEAEKRYYYSQALFNFQFKLLSVVAKKGYMSSRHDWKHRGA